jgi:hypothetical protein
LVSSKRQKKRRRLLLKQSVKGEVQRLQAAKKAKAEQVKQQYAVHAAEVAASQGILSS